MMNAHDKVSDDQRALVLRVAEILGSPVEAQDWLRRPTQVFGGRRPLELLGTGEGRLCLDDYLRRLESGADWLAKLDGSRQGNLEPGRS